MAFKLNKLLQAYQPDIIISTHPFGSQMCSYLKKKGKIHSIIATVMTDYAPHNQWLVGNAYISYFFVAHQGMKEQLISQGIPSQKIAATGIPLSQKFLSHYNKEQIIANFGLDFHKKTILFFGGGEFGLGKEKTVAVLKAFIHSFDDIQIVAISGKNEKMKKAFSDAVEEAGKQSCVKILEYTDKVPELMSISSLVVTKPGGLTTTESLASGLPIVMINPLPGQEEENAMFLESKKVGVWIKKEDNPQEVISHLLQSPELLQQMKINAKLLAKKTSTRDICNILMNTKKD